MRFPRKPPARPAAAETAALLRRIPPAAVVDGVALLAFLVIGGDVHGATRPAGLLRNALIFLPVWYLAALRFGLYRDPSWTTFLRTWFAAIPIAVVLRQLWVGRLFTPGTLLFLAAALVVTIVFLLAGRFLAMLAGMEDPR